MAMTWEGYSHLLLRACRVNPQQMVSLFSPFGGIPPTTEQQFNQMEMAIRRMGHILEGTTFSLARQLQRPTQQTFLNEQSMQPSAPPPDQFGGQDPWASQSANSSWVQVPQSQPTDPWANYGPTSGTYAQLPTSQYYTGDGLSDTDSDTVSTCGEPDYSDPTLQGMTPQQIDTHLFWQYQRHKANHRKHFKKPVRKVRKFLKRKGRGKGKGHVNRLGFLSTMSDQE